MASICTRERYLNQRISIWRVKKKKEERSVGNDGGERKRGIRRMKGALKEGRKISYVAWLFCGAEKISLKIVWRSVKYDISISLLSLSTTTSHSTVATASLWANFNMPSQHISYHQYPSHVMAVDEKVWWEDKAGTGSKEGQYILKRRNLA